MPKPKRLFADPVSEIRSQDTGELLGWAYRWNTGEIVSAWVDDRQDAICLRPAGGAASPSKAATSAA